MRVVMTRVLPVPAPASTSSGPSVVETASRCAGLSVASKASAPGAWRRRTAVEDREEGAKRALLLSRSGATSWSALRRQVRHPQLLAAGDERRPRDLAAAGDVVEEVDRGRPLEVGHVGRPRAVDLDPPQRHRARVARALIARVAHEVDLFPVLRPARLGPVEAEA